MEFPKDEEELQLMNLLVQDTASCAANTDLLDNNFVEITNIPKKIDAKALTSMIVSISKIVPKSTEICYKGDCLEVVGLIEFKSGVDAYKAVGRIRSSPIVKRWKLKIVSNPKFNDPEKDMINRWLR